MQPVIDKRVLEANQQALSGQVGGAVTTSGDIVRADGSTLPTSLTSNDLVGGASYQIPETKTSTLAEGISGYAVAGIEQGKLAKEQAIRASEAQAVKESSKSALEKAQQDIIGVNASRGKLEQEAGVSNLVSVADEARMSLEASERAKTNELRALTGKGLTDIQRGQAEREITRRYAFEQADLSITADVAERRLDRAVRTIDRKIELQLEPLKMQYDFTKAFYEENKSLFDKEDQRLFDAKVKDLDRQYTQESDNLKSVKDLNLKLIDKGITPSSGQLNAKSMEEWQKNTPAGQMKSTGATTISPGMAEDPFIQGLLGTAGGKALTDTTIQKLDKGLTVLGQLGVLQNNISDIKTGPIIGAFRSANPWDTNAQVIKNQLNAIVPNLARGIYGEVGVLTDNDIATYSKTIPTLKSTEEVRNAVLYITLDMIGKSIKNTLSVNAAANRDVSGFVEIYTEMEDTKNSILSSIPGAQVPKAFQGQQTQDNNDPLGIKSLLGI